MGKDILAEIVWVEKEIGARLADERRSAAKRLEALRGDCDTELCQEEERLRRELETALSAARENAERQAAALVAAEAVRSAALAGLDDGTMQRLIWRHLARIAPGKKDDSQDVQG